MTAVHVLFYILSFVAITSGLMVVTVKSPVHSVLFLVLTFFATAGIWLLLQAEFLALILVLVYVGAVMTLFLFVVMLLSVQKISVMEGFVRYLPLAALTVLLVVGLSIVVLGPNQFGLAEMTAPVAKSADYSNTADLGSVLYTEHAYPFEIAAVLLLTAIVAAISLTHRPPHNRKKQNIDKQIATQRNQSVRLVKMPSEKKRTR